MYNKNMRLNLPFGLHLRKTQNALMKFTKEQAIESLKSELTNKGKKTLRMSEKTMDAIVDTLLPKFANDDTGLPDFIAEALPLLSTVNDNIGNDRSQFIKKWNTEHPETPTDNANPTPNPVTPSSDNEMLIALKKEVDELRQAQEQAKQAAEISTKRQSLADKLKEKGVKDENWVNDLLSEVSIDKDFDVDSKADTYLRLYNKSMANVPPTPQPKLPAGSHGANGEKPAAIAAAAEMVKRSKALGTASIQQ
jgi:hypothetical protein